MSIRSRSRSIRLAFLAFFLLFCYLSVLHQGTSSVFARSSLSLEIESNHTAQILKAVQQDVLEVVSPHDDQLLLSPSASKSCSDSGRPNYLLIMVVTSPENYKRRKVIRDIFSKKLESWNRIVKQSPENLNNTFGKEDAIKTLFFMGKSPNNATILESVIQEGKLYEDIIVDDFEDSYLNLTVKTLRMLKWVESNCPRVTYLAKLDDDVHLNLPLVLSFLSQYYKKFPNQTADLIAGHKYIKIERDTNPNSKWFTPEILWKRKFPNFVSGVFYVLGNRAKSELYNGALQSNLFHLEDVFLTGMIREKFLSQDVIDIPGITIDWRFDHKMTFPCTFAKETSAAHPLSAKEMSCFSKVPDYCWNLFFVPLFILC